MEIVREFDDDVVYFCQICRHTKEIQEQYREFDEEDVRPTGRCDSPTCPLKLKVMRSSSEFTLYAMVKKTALDLLAEI